MFPRVLGTVADELCRQIIYNGLTLLTVLSLATASHRGPGTPDPSLAPESEHTVEYAVPELHPPPSKYGEQRVNDDEIPLKFLKNPHWMNTRIGKDRPSPLPLGSRKPRQYIEQPSDGSSSSDTAAHSPFPFVASPFVPANLDETGEDEEDRIEGSLSHESRADVEADTKEEANIADASDRDRLLASRSEERQTRRSVMAKANTGGPRWCKKCDTWKPDRSHHCRFCQRCSLKSAFSVHHR